MSGTGTNSVEQPIVITSVADGRMSPGSVTGEHIVGMRSVSTANSIGKVSGGATRLWMTT